ncbi:AAA family ATPase [Candidatus Leptofilum sp.]|uniref:AAA family ATPase n=1 Tax=Candidatus Leptofilum sp. TaxID=3241576 RepID=UPI003B5C2DF2
MPNPFFCCSCIQNPKYFFGREKELVRIFNALETTHTGQMQSVSVVGPRRIGRSSLLVHVTQTFDQRLRHPENYIFYYADLLSGRYSTRLGLLQNILGGLADKLPNTAESLKVALKTVSQLPEITLGQFEEAIALFRQDSANPLCPVICLDEIEQLTKYSDEFPRWLFDSWRSLINNGSLAFVISSSKPLFEMAEEESLTSPFFNIFSDYLSLGELTEAEAFRLAEQGKRCERPFTTEDIERVREWGEQHPLKLQQAGATIYHAKAETNPKWRDVKADFENKVGQAFGQRPAKQRWFNGLLSIVETVGKAVPLGKAADQKVHRLVGSFILLVLFVVLTLWLLSPAMRSWIVQEINFPTSTPVPVPTDTPIP